SPGTTASLGGLGALDLSRAFAVEVGGANVFAWTDGAGAWAPLGTARADRKAAATWAPAANDVWVAGDVVEHWDGAEWSLAVASGTSFAGLSGSFDTDLWAVGAGGVQHYDGRGWAPVAVPAGTPALAAAWSASLFDTWIVGAAGTVLHWNGTNVARVTTSGTLEDLTSVSGTGSGDVWIGGRNGLLLHWDGATWIEHTTDARRTIEDVWAAEGAPVLFVDGSGVIGRYGY
ncbi:MAG: hypothetical protein JWM82_132, partial [Myxococcales bacterium]|nr:hypothetical protein [Myxococcales bacterium]